MRLYVVGKRIPPGSKNRGVAEIAKIAANFERSTMRDQEASKSKSSPIYHSYEVRSIGNTSGNTANKRNLILTRVI